MEKVYDYQEYKENVLALLRRKYGTDVVVEVVVAKTDGKHSDAICFRAGTNAASPIVYFDNRKAQYTDYDVDRFINLAEEKYKLAKQFTDNKVKHLYSWDDVKTKIYPQLFNYEKNKNGLSKIPHVRFLDLAVGFFCNTTSLFAKDEIGAMTVTNRMKKIWGVTDEQLNETAMENLRKLVCDIKSLEEVAAIYGAEMREEQSTPLYTVSVYTGMFGAAALLNNEFLKEVCTRTGSTKLWIIASSVHELMILPYEYAEEAFCAYNTAVAFNELIEPDDMLSDNLYVYDDVTEKVEIYEGENRNGQA